MPRIPNWLFYVVALIVIGLWAVGIVLSFVSSSFQMPAPLNSAVPIVLASLYGVRAYDGNDEDDDDRRRPVRRGRRRR